MADNPVIVNSWFALAAAIAIPTITACVAWLKSKAAERKTNHISDLKAQLVIANRHIEDLRIMARVLLDKEKLLEQYEIMKEDLAVKAEARKLTRSVD